MNKNIINQNSGQKKSLLFSNHTSKTALINIDPSGRVAHEPENGKRLDGTS